MNERKFLPRKELAHRLRRGVPILTQQTSVWHLRLPGMTFLVTEMRLLMKIVTLYSASLDATELLAIPCPDNLNRYVCIPRIFADAESPIKFNVNGPLRGCLHSNLSVNAQNTVSSTENTEYPAAKTRLGNAVVFK